MHPEELIDDNEWSAHLADYFDSSIWQNLRLFLADEYASHTIYPPQSEIFNALNLTPFQKVRVVILGQDPYHGPDQAHGLAFSVKSPCPPPPSLKNIFKELGFKSDSGDLTSWADQGVLLLNTVLTVRQAQAHSHKGKGWEKLTDLIIQKLSEEREQLIFVLWGSAAQKKKELIDSDKHIVLESVHPSPLSAHRGFLGCGHFNEINNLLSTKKEEPINWRSVLALQVQPDLF